MLNAEIPALNSRIRLRVNIYMGFKRRRGSSIPVHTAVQLSESCRRTSRVPQSVFRRPTFRLTSSDLGSSEGVDVSSGGGALCSLTLGVF